MALFRDYVLLSPVRPDTKTTIEDVLQATVLFMIQLDRAGHVIERQLIKHCIYMLEGLYETVTEEESSRLYLTLFEPKFLETSRTFYREEGKRLLETGDAATFCRETLNRLQQEGERCLSMLSPVTEPKIKDVLDTELIERNICDVIKLEGSGVKYMLDHDKVDVLKNVYELISRVDREKSFLATVLQERIYALGQEINASSITLVQPPTNTQLSKAAEKQPNGEKSAEKEKEKPVNQQTVAAIRWVDEVLALKRKFDSIWERAFMSDQGIQASITKSFSDFVNSNVRSSEYLSLFFDENLKKGIKGKTETEVDALLDNGITLLRYVKDKDLFETYFKKHLSRRLLMKRSASMDAERQIIARMKMEVGNQFTQRIEAMFKDMAISDDMTSSYKDHIARTGSQDQKRVELEVSVLTSTMWPLEVMSSSKEFLQRPCTFPKEVDSVKQSFEQFYLSKHNGRKLWWQPGMGTADIRATFQRPNGKVARHELNVSTYAMLILTLFNDVPDGSSLSFEEIQARTQIPEHDLIRNLQSLAVAPKTRVLKKEPMSKDVKSTDQFFFNRDYQSMFTKVRIGVVSSGANRVENTDERKETEKKMGEERGSSVEAAIVRIMK